MPYADAERQRAAKAASARRTRAAQRGTIVEPVVPAVTNTDLAAVGRVLGCARGDGEPPEQYHTRLRAVWQHLLRVVDA